jgi:hypothetical protein
LRWLLVETPGNLDCVQAATQAACCRLDRSIPTIPIATCLAATLRQHTTQAAAKGFDETPMHARKGPCTKGLVLAVRLVMMMTLTANRDNDIDC